MARGTFRFPGLHDVAKALVAAYLTHELRRPAFFITDSNRRAEALAETVRFFSSIFPGASGWSSDAPGFRHAAMGIAEPAPGHSRAPRGNAFSPDGWTSFARHRSGASSSLAISGRHALLVARANAHKRRGSSPRRIRRASRGRWLHAHGNGRTAGTIRDARRHRGRLFRGGAAPGEN